MDQRENGYLFVHFTGESPDGEQVYFALSRDGMHWQDLNGGRPVIRSGIGEKGVRDPFIIKSVIDGKFYIIATDLRIASKKGWTAAQMEGVPGSLSGALKICFTGQNPGVLRRESRGPAVRGRRRLSTIRRRDPTLYSGPP